MKRTLVYPSEQPTDSLWLSLERNHMVALAYLTQGTLGTNTIIDGISCTPTVPGSLAVQFGPGAIYQQLAIDATLYGTLPQDNINQIVKQGIALTPPNLTLTPPSTSGQAINYLIQATLNEVDGENTILSYFNSAQPTIPYTGPNGNGQAQPTVRDCQLVLQAKPGAPAAAGTQVTPAPDAGYVGLYVITVANGDTAIVSGKISLYPGAPFINVKLPGVPSYVQAGTYKWSADTGSANAMIVTLNPVPTAVQAGFEVFVKKTGSANTGAMTINVNGLGVQSIINADGSAMTTSQAPANFRMHLIFDGSAWVFMNSAVSTAVGSLSAQSGEGITVDGTGHVSLNIPGLTAQPTISNTDLFAFYSQTDVHHRNLSFAQFVAALTGALPSIYPMASPTEHLAGTLLTKVTNPSGVQAMINNAAKSLQPSGYYTLPGGLIIQWVKGVVDPAGTAEYSHSINWPIPFPTAIFGAVISQTTISQTGQCDCDYQIFGPPTATGCTYFRNWTTAGLVGTQTYPFIIALGY